MKNDFVKNDREIVGGSVRFGAITFFVLILTLGILGSPTNATEGDTSGGSTSGGSTSGGGTPIGTSEPMDCLEILWPESTDLESGYAILVARWMATNLSDASPEPDDEPDIILYRVPTSEVDSQGEPMVLLLACR